MKYLIFYKIYNKQKIVNSSIFACSLFCGEGKEKKVLLSRIYEILCKLHVISDLVYNVHNKYYS